MSPAARTSVGSQKCGSVATLTSLLRQPALELFGARSTSSETRAMLRISVEPRQGLIVKPLFRVRKKQRQKGDAETATVTVCPPVRP
jgi:hypothetical protein